MRRLLIHPPLADPTQPYLSLPVLKGHLRSCGLDATVIDLNVLAAAFLLREDPETLEAFQDREQFFDPVVYEQARRRVEAVFEEVSARCSPYRFGFNCLQHERAPWSFARLWDYASGRWSPFAELYEGLFAGDHRFDADGLPAMNIDLEEVDFVGISIVFPSQLAEALHLARFLRDRVPDAFIALGGPCIHQIALHLDDPKRRKLLEFADGIGLYEGEGLLAGLFPRLGAWGAARSAGEKLDILKDVPNLLVWDEQRVESHIGPTHQVDLRSAPLPDYSDLDLDRYLAPDRILLYAPTRGCYWNKCSFCYYGLSDFATASYREVPPERVASDLIRLKHRHGVRNFYLSCDVLSPAYAVRLAEALLAANAKIRWSCDLKIERYYTPERCELLYRSGLRAAAFGIESGSDRILTLMRKGCDRETMTAVNRSFHRAGIATEWMTFTQHPGETTEEALDTVRWIDSERRAVDLFIVGEFGLERGSDIYLHPERYGITRIFFARDDELELRPLCEEEMDEGVERDRNAVDKAIDKTARGYVLRPYPWAGAVSTHHSFLYFLSFGPGAFRSERDRIARAAEGLAGARRHVAK